MNNNLKNIIAAEIKNRFEKKLIIYLLKSKFLKK